MSLETITIAAIVLGILLATFIVLRLVQGSDRRRAAASPLPSPVAWLDDEVWHALNPREYLERRAVLHSPVVTDPILTAVLSDDLQRVPTLPVPEAPLPPPGPLHEQRTRLLATPGQGFIRSAVWPMCCDRLGVLVARHVSRTRLAALEATAGPLDQAYLEGEIGPWEGPRAGEDRRTEIRQRGWGDVLALIRSREHSGQGLNVFQCRSCGRIYVASCAPDGPVRLD